jgi:hypothetical protein
LKFLIVLFFFIPFLVKANSCPPSVVISVQCAPNKKDFQLVKHLGKYTLPKMEYDNATNIMICSYESDQWASKYRYINNNQEKFINASSLNDLVDVVNIINSTGFKADYFSNKSNPYVMLTYKENNNYFHPDQIFLYSGLESTFGNNGFTVSALSKDAVSTYVINERYLKSQNIAADTFQTGSNCTVAIK